jgi:hypothetical protein
MILPPSLPSPKGEGVSNLYMKLVKLNIRQDDLFKNN